MFRHAALALAAALAMSFASPAMAFHCKGSHASEPGCETPPPGGGDPPGPLVVRDDNDALVGTLLDHDQVSLSVNTVVQTDVAGTPRIFIVAVTDAGFHSLNNSGFAWSEGTLCEVPLFKAPGILLGVEFAFVEDGIAYISDPAEVPQNITAQSRLLSDGGCLTETVAVTDVIATVDVDLDALFDPPYTLGF